MTIPHERLRRLQEAQAEALERRNGTDCRHYGRAIVVAEINAGGTRTVFDACADCKRPLKPGHWLPASASWFDDVEVVADARSTRPPCQRCGALGTELHHTAPRAIFGKAEAECWPTVWLCPGCHSYWHQMMAARRP